MGGLGIGAVFGATWRLEEGSNYDQSMSRKNSQNNWLLNGEEAMWVGKEVKGHSFHEKSFLQSFKTGSSDQEKLQS